MEHSLPGLWRSTSKRKEPDRPFPNFGTSKSVPWRSLTTKIYFVDPLILRLWNCERAGRETALYKLKKPVSQGEHLRSSKKQVFSSSILISWNWAANYVQFVLCNGRPRTGIKYMFKKNKKRRLERIAIWIQILKQKPPFCSWNHVVVLCRHLRHDRKHNEFEIMNHSSWETWYQPADTAGWHHV